MTHSTTAAPTKPHFTDRAQHGFRWVYLWHWPIRVMHWAAALSIVVLVLTGFYIGKPYFMTGGELQTAYAMGWMRFLHFTAAGVLIATAIVRAYWLFVGNKFERWTALFPVRKRDWVSGWRVLKKYLFIHPERAPHYLGHNPMQQLSYTAIYGVAFVQVVTGFAMYGLADPGGLFYSMFTSWISPLFGGIQIVRFVHHILTWVFVIFFPIHVYLSLRADALHNEARVSSIISGGRFVRENVEFVDD